MKLGNLAAVTTSMGIFFQIGNSLENENISYNLFVKHVPKITQKLWPEPMALAFQNLRQAKAGLL